jgi:hypothetical protein
MPERTDTHGHENCQRSNLRVAVAPESVMQEVPMALIQQDTEDGPTNLLVLRKGVLSPANLSLMRRLLADL